MAELNELALVNGLRDGLPEAVALLVEHYRDRLVVHAERVLRDRGDAEDVAQEVLMKARGAALPVEPRSLSGWLYAVTWRTAVDRLRTRRVEARTIREFGARSVGASVPSPAVAAEHGDEVLRVAAALHALDEPYRTALTLRYLEGAEFSEVAQRMEALERTVRTWVGRGLTRLRADLVRKGDES